MPANTNELTKSPPANNAEPRQASLASLNLMQTELIVFLSQQQRALQALAASSPPLPPCPLSGWWFVIPLCCFTKTPTLTLLVEPLCR